MLEAIIILLLVFWLLGMVLSYGSIVHLLLVVALIMFVFRLFTGRKAF